MKRLAKRPMAENTAEGAPETEIDILQDAQVDRRLSVVTHG